MSASTDQGDLDLFYQVVYGEYERLTQDERKRAHWIMDADMFAWIRGLQRDFSSSFWSPPPADEPVTLLGKPIEIRDGAEGIRLVADEAPQ